MDCQKKVKGGIGIMVSWKNFDTLASYGKLLALKGRVNLVEAMSGENGAKRVAEYSVPMACGII